MASPDVRRCVQCATTLTADQAFCTACGTPVVPQAVVATSMATITNDRERRMPRDEPTTSTAAVTVDDTTPSIGEPAPATGAPLQPPAPYTGRTELYGHHVAVLWSMVTADLSPSEVDATVETQLAAFRLRFGDRVLAVDSNDYRSLRDGTVAVIHDGGFASASEAKRWCRSSGFPGLDDCFGVVLSDDYRPQDRGEFVRVYDL